MENAEVVEKKPPFECPARMTYHELEDFLVKEVGLSRGVGVMNARAKISNIMLGRNQEPTVMDAMMAERVYQKKKLEDYEYCPQWEHSDITPNIWTLVIRVKEKGENIPATIAFGWFSYIVVNEGGFLSVKDGTLLSIECVLKFDGFTVFTDCQGFTGKPVGWAYAVSLTREIHAWAGEEEGAKYDAFIKYSRYLIESKRAQGVEVKLVPKGQDQVNVAVVIHRAGVAMAGFTTMVEYNEVLIKKEK
jgi:hypothetical protein